MDNFFICYYETTRRCNINCAYCMTKTEPRGEELTTDEAKHLVIDEVRKISSRAAIGFSGGEFFLRPDAMELVSYASQKGLFVIINTNALLVYKKLVRELKRLTSGRLILSLSMNSINKKKNRVTRDDEPSAIKKAAKICLKESVGLFVMVTISRQNLDSLKDTFKFLSKHGIPVLRSPFVPRGEGAKFKHYQFDSSEMEKHIHPILRDNCMAYISYTPFFADPGHVKSVLKNAGLAISNVGCQAARGFIAVSAEGFVSPCVQLLDSPIECGNVRKEKLSEIFSGHPLMKAMNKRQGYKGKCGKCVYIESCGGCRAMAYYQGGDVMGEDPTCFFEPNNGNRSVHESAHHEKLSEFLETVSKYPQFKDLFG
jgi:radical SAM protein with 4Fe4S-binding SPASM domain